MNSVTVRGEIEEMASVDDLSDWNCLLTENLTLFRLGLGLCFCFSEVMVFEAEVKKPLIGLRENLSSFRADCSRFRISLIRTKSDSMESNLSANLISLSFSS